MRSSGSGADAPALVGVRVVELGYGIAGSFAARLLADLGADAVKVEHPRDEDPLRRAEPLIEDASGDVVGALFEFLSWNKRSLALDVDDLASRPALRALVESAHVVIVSERAVAPETLRSWNPRAAVVAVSRFGADGPFAVRDATDLVLQATGGIMQISGNADREPLKLGLRQSLYVAGLNAAYAALAAYYGALVTGSGAVLDLAIRDCVSAQLVMNQPFYAFVGIVQGRRPAVNDPLDGEPIPVADGYAALQVSATIQSEQYAELFGDERLADPRFATRARRIANAAELRELLEGHLCAERGHDLFGRAADRGFLVGVVQGARELLECPQLAARDVWHSFPELPGYRFPAVLARLTRTPARVVRRAPRHGEHSEELLAELGRPPAPAARAPARVRPRPGERRRPLEGLRVLDLSTVFAVPYVAAILSDLGAEVIKVEAPRRLDQTRLASWHGVCFDNDTSGDYWNRQALFQALNRGKRSLSLDLGTEQGRDVLRALVERSDLLLENFTPRVMRSWSTTYEELAALNPRLIMLSNTGYGSTGPWSAFKAQGTTLEVTMGLAQYTGYEGGRPSKAGQSYPDFLAAWSGLVAILAALVERRRTGRGQWIDLGMYQLGLSVIPEALLHYQATGEDLPRRGNADPDALVSAVVPTAGDDRWLAVAVRDADRLRALAGVVPALAPLVPAGGEAPDAERRRLIVEALAAWSKSRDGSEAAAELQRAGIAAGPVCDARDLLLDPQLRHRGFYEWVDYERADDGGETVRRPLVGRPYRWESESTFAAIQGPPPCFGDANEHVLRELLGLSEERIAELYELEVVTGAPLGLPVDPPPADLESMRASGVIAALDARYRDVVGQPPGGRLGRAAAPSSRRRARPPAHTPARGALPG